MSTIIMSGGGGGMGGAGGLVRQIVNVAILYGMWLIAKYAYEQHYVKDEPISITEMLGKFNISI